MQAISACHRHTWYLGIGSEADRTCLREHVQLIPRERTVLQSVSQDRGVRVVSLNQFSKGGWQKSCSSLPFDHTRLSRMGGAYPSKTSDSLVKKGEVIDALTLFPGYFRWNTNSVGKRRHYTWGLPFPIFQMSCGKTQPKAQFLAMAVPSHGRTNGFREAGVTKSDKGQTDIGKETFLDWDESIIKVLGSTEWCNTPVFFLLGQYELLLLLALKKECRTSRSMYVKSGVIYLFVRLSFGLCSSLEVLLLVLDWWYDYDMDWGSGLLRTYWLY
jgi:hypothetical protein